MKVLHTSDWHLGQYFHKQKSRAAEHAQFIEWLLQQVVLYQIDAVIVAGDVFDTGSPPSYARKLYAHFIHQLHRLGCQLIVLAGNHDSVAMLEESKPLIEALKVQVIADVNPTDVSPQVVVLHNRQGEPGAVVMAIPFLRPQSLVTSVAGQTSASKQASLQQAITDHYMQTYTAAKQVQQALAQPVPIVATGHLTACHIQATGSEREIYIGTLAAFPAASFPPATYIALGHIHRPQRVAQQEHIRYCGAPIPLSFDELQHDKEVLLVEFKGADLSSVQPLTVPRFQPMAVLRGTLTAVAAQLEAMTFVATQPPVWLKIEIDLGDSTRTLLLRELTALAARYPVEILQSTVLHPNSVRLERRHCTEQLQDLEPVDVFEKRLAHLEVTDAAKHAQMDRLRVAFKSIVDDLKLEGLG